MNSVSELFERISFIVLTKGGIFDLFICKFDCLKVDGSLIFDNALKTHDPN